MSIVINDQGQYEPYQTGWNDGYSEGYACKLADVTAPFMPSGTAEEVTRVADWLQRKYAAQYGMDRPSAIGMARGMIAAARDDTPAEGQADAGERPHPKPEGGERDA